jgi:predicted aspartyl protease
MKKLSLVLLLLNLPGSLPAQRLRTGVLANFDAQAAQAAVTRAKNRPLAEVKFERAFGGIVFFPAAVNSAGPLQFLLDTGGAGSSVDREVANRLGLKMARGQASVSGNAALEVGVIPEATVQVGQGQFKGQLLAAPLSPLEPIFGRPLEGILGGSFMQHYVVELDFKKDVMRLYEPTEFQYVEGGVALPFSLVNGIPFVELEVSLPNGKSARGSFLIDTGGNMVVHLYKQVAEGAGLLDKLPTLAETGYGIGGGATRRVAARGSTLLVGPYRFSRPIVVFSEDTAGLRANPASIGLIGMEVLRRFKVTFDYSRKRMYLEPNGSFNEPFVYDASGLRLRASRPSFSPPSVSGVLDSSPALEAGIERGDVLLQIDGRSTSGVSLEAIRALLKQPGKTHKLTLARNQKNITTLLRTREMLN